MSDPLLPRLDAQQLIALGRRHAAATPCETCSSLVCPGWETVPASLDRAGLRRRATLRDPAIDDPTVVEHHPAGTHAWSVDAPIAPAFFPYNRCDVWQCVACARPFLRYTEYGGYYVDERIREVNAELVDDAPLGAAPAP